MQQQILVSLLDELKIGLAEIYGDRLYKVFLFGSYARGDQDGESDFDVLIILYDIERVTIEIKRTGLLISELSLKYSISISRTFVSYDTWLHGDSPLLRNARQEAIPV